MRYVLTTAGAALTAGLLFGATHASAADCRSLSGKQLGEALIVETNDIKPPFVVTSMGPRAVTVTNPFCRVRALVRPTHDSEIYFEVWMPPPGVWNGRYQGNAPGGFAGSMFYEPSERALRAGFAASTTDNGHVGPNALEWAVGHPQKVADWGWRAVHETAVASKAIIAAYYGSAPKYSYFVGCSKGGGSAITEAQRFPGDYNGIVAAAMGWDHSAQLAKSLWNVQAVQAPGGWISPAKLAALHSAVMAACGAKGAFLDDPGKCSYDPGRLQCKAGDRSDCLTAQQVATVRRIYSGPLDGNGRPLFAGSERGSELGWSAAFMGPEDRPGMGTGAFDSATNMVQALLFEDPSRSLAGLEPAALYAQSRAKLGAAWDAMDPDLSAFKAAGGKMISYHGWNDLNVPPRSSTLYYDQVAAKMGGVGEVRSFYRLFMGPGMDHCGGGFGPNAVGGAYSAPAPSDDPEHDVAAALARWVERGAPPEQLVATRYVDNDPVKGIAAQRPWCPYPATAIYGGRGDPNQASSWSCPAPGKGH